VEGEGGAGCEEASAFDFPLPPFGVCSSRKPWNLVVDPRLAASSCLQLLLISWAVMACFFHWEVAGQMLPMAPKYFPSLPVEAERQTFMEFSGVYARRYVCMQVRVRACTCEGNEGVLSLGPSSLIEGQSASQAVCPPWGP